MKKRNVVKLAALGMMAATLMTGINVQAEGEKVVTAITSLDLTPELCDPIKSGPDFRLYEMIYDPLVRYGENGEIEPALAESWDISEDGTTYTFHLRKDAKFSDGTEFNADNVLWNYNRWVEQDVTGNFSAKLEDVTKVDDYTVEFKDFSLKSQLYDLDVLGYKGNKNKLHLFDIASVDESMVHDGISFDKSNIVRNLTLFLYPDDSDEAGRKLRIYQQYFMVSNGAQMILEDIKSKGISLTDLDKHVCIQINDTHPSMVIPELIRLLMKEGLTMKQAIDITSKTCAYTNHTILAEALEKWPLSYLEEIVPQLVPIIEALDAVAKERSTNEKVAIIDNNKLVHMAHMDIHFGFSINGVASIHTDILKNTELHDFYELYPTHFNNKTNGITFRRWLLSCNEELTDLIDSLIGEGYKQDASELEKLQKYLSASNLDSPRNSSGACFKPPAI